MASTAFQNTATTAAMAVTDMADPIMVVIIHPMARIIIIQNGQAIPMATRLHGQSIIQCTATEHTVHHQFLVATATAIHTTGNKPTILKQHSWPRII